ncbi:MAG: glucokinase [Chromatiales bacterium]
MGRERRQPPLALLADVGGTYTRLAVALPSGELAGVEIHANADYPDIESLLRRYLETVPPEIRPRHAALAVACPVTGEVVRLTNLHWSFAAGGLRERFDFHTVRVVNDFSAIAFAIPGLTAEERVQIGGGSSQPGAPIAVLGPGTGLGVSGLLPTANRWTAIAGEGGHATLAAGTDAEERLLACFRRRYEHVSAERVLCGNGLVDLYRCLAPTPLTTNLTPEEITARALGGNDEIAAAVLETFFGLLGGFAGNLALTLGALGGVYLAGGILPQLVTRLPHSPFRERFAAKGRFRSYLEAIPTYVIVAANPAFSGLLRCLRD